MSGPLRDRLDLTVDLAPVPFDALTAAPSGEASAGVRRRVEAARAVQRERAARTGAAVNSRLPPAALEAVARLGPDAMRRLSTAAERLRLSGRAVHRTLRVARTIADLESSSDVSSEHVLEALQFRAGGPTT